MNPYELVDNDTYIACLNPLPVNPTNNPANQTTTGNVPTIRIFKLLHPNKENMLLEPSDWTRLPDIINPRITLAGYDSIKINNHVISGPEYIRFAQNLCNSRLLVNMLGYCFLKLDRRRVANTKAYGTTFYRMNDMWNWARYGVVTVDLKTAQPRMRWDRLDILHGTPIIFDLKGIEHKLDTTKTDLVVSRGRVSSLETNKKSMQNENDKLKKFGLTAIVSF